MSAFCVRFPTASGTVDIVSPDTSGVCPVDTGTYIYMGVTGGSWDPDSFETLALSEAETLAGFAITALAIAFTFRLLRDMILNRR